MRVTGCEVSSCKKYETVCTGSTAFDRLGLKLLRPLIGKGSRYGSEYLSGADTRRQRRLDHWPDLLVQSFSSHVALLAVRKRLHEISFALPGTEQSLTEQIVVRSNAP